jgi:trehalose 6-phosphate synthase/phosphatase
MATATIPLPTITEAPPTSRRGLVVVSGRLPFRAVRRAGEVVLARSPGGLVAGLEPALEQQGGVWVGWPGIERERLSRRAPLPAGERGVRYHPVQLTAGEVAGFYTGFANGTLWPLFHYFVGRIRIDAATWRAYDRVNARFAREAVAAGGPDDLVWVHDYQLLRTPHYVRRHSPRRPIAFFLHIPFPAYDVLRLLPWSRELMRGMLAADLVGFHTEDYVRHFLLCAERLLGCEVNAAAGQVVFEGRQVAVQAHPLGIDVGAVEHVARMGHDRRRRTLRVLGVDRLDYTKGIPERLLAIERFFERHPQYRRRVVYTQIAVPTRERVDEYRDLKREIDELVGRINGRFAAGRWSPIRYLVRSVPPDVLFRLYRGADVALVTPLRDGMNLVAKEYVAAQIEDQGVLVLSEMAGAAAELQEALVVNPFDVDGVAETLFRALAMPDDERRARMSALRDRVRAHTVSDWVSRFLSSAEEAWRLGRTGVPPVERVKRRLAPWLAQRPTTVLFLDFDGTLTPIVDRPEHAVLSEAARLAVAQAVRSPHIDCVVISGRALDDLRRRVGVEGLTYVGDHGFDIEGPGLRFVHPEIGRWQRALDRAAVGLERLAVPGALIERKGASVAFHLRPLPPRVRWEAARRAEDVLASQRLRVCGGKLIVEGRPGIAWHKGHAVLEVLVRRHGADWPNRARTLYVGDDRTDEDAFVSLRGIGRSILVSPGSGRSSVAEFTLPDPESVVQLVRWLAAGGFTAGTAAP